MGLVPSEVETRELALSLPCAHMARKCVCKPGRDLSPGTEPASASVLDLQPPEL